SLIITLLPSLVLLDLVIKPLSSIDFSVRVRLVGSIPIFGASAVEGVPSLSILNKVKPKAIVAPYLEASSLYIRATACQVALKTKSIVFSFIGWFIRFDCVNKFVLAFWFSKDKEKKYYASILNNIFFIRFCSKKKKLYLGALIHTI